MLLCGICSRWFPNTDIYLSISRSTWVTIIIRACPWLEYTARPEAKLYYERDTIDVDLITNYLIVNKEYDAIEVSRIISSIKEVVA